MAPLPLSLSVAAVLALKGKQSPGTLALLSSSQELGVIIVSRATSLNHIKHPLLTNVIYVSMKKLMKSKKILMNSKFSNKICIHFL